MESNILVIDRDGTLSFLNGVSVFKIIALGKDGERICGMVNTKEEYEKKLADHYYVSVLHISPITYRLAYLYDCLNREKGVAREETFTFWYRILGKHEWVKWFVVSPYID